MRIRASDVLDLLAAGLSPAEVVAELPDLEIEDVTACLKFASLQASQPGAAARSSGLMLTSHRPLLDGLPKASLWSVLQHATLG